MASDENRKKDHAQRDIISRIPNWGWLLIPFLQRCFCGNGCL